MTYRLEHGDHRPVASLHLPHTIAVSNPGGEPLWSLKVEKFWTKVSVPEGAFALTASGT
jgi:hypothetical protein